MLVRVPTKMSVTLIPSAGMFTECVSEALKSRYIKKIIITTNCIKVIKYSQKFFLNKKIKILKRSNNLARDNTPMLPVIKNAIEKGLSFVIIFFNFKISGANGRL